MPGIDPSLDGARAIGRGGSVKAPYTTTAATKAAVTNTSFFTGKCVEPALQPGCGLESRGLVGALPVELFLGAAEMSERRRALVDRAAQVEFFHDAAGRQ